MRFEPTTSRIAVYCYSTRPQSQDEKSATYDCVIQQTPKYALLAHKMYNVQTHFGFTTLWSKLNTFWVLGNWKVKKVSGTPCKSIKMSSFLRNLSIGSIKVEKRRWIYSYWSYLIIQCAKSKHSLFFFFAGGDQTGSISILGSGLFHLSTYGI